MFGETVKKLAVPVFSFLALVGCSSQKYVEKPVETDVAKLVKLVEKHGFSANYEGTDYKYIAFSLGKMRMEIGVFGNNDSLIINERNLETRISDTKFKDTGIDGLGEGDFIKVFDEENLRFIDIYPSDTLSATQMQSAYNQAIKSTVEKVMFFYEQNFFERIRIEGIIKNLVDRNDSNFKVRKSGENEYSFTKDLDSQTKMRITYTDNPPYFYEAGNNAALEDEFKIVYYKKCNDEYYASKILFDRGVNSFGNGDFIAEMEKENITRSFTYSEEEHAKFRDEAWKILSDAESALGLRVP